MEVDQQEKPSLSPSPSSSISILDLSSVGSSESRSPASPRDIVDLMDSAEPESSHEDHSSTPESGSEIFLKRQQLPPHHSSSQHAQDGYRPDASTSGKPLLPYLNGDRDRPLGGLLPEQLEWKLENYAVFSKLNRDEAERRKLRIKRAEREQYAEVDTIPEDRKCGWEYSLEAEVEPRTAPEVPRPLQPSKKGKGRAEDSRPLAYDWPNMDKQDASFFPYPHLPGLKHLQGVVAILSAEQVDLIRIRDSSTNASAGASVEIIPLGQYLSKPGDLLVTCAWSVNTSTWPYTPILALGTRAGVIEVLKLQTFFNREVKLSRDRTLTGHGGCIRHLTFSTTRPHMLLSASDDRTVRIWDPTLHGSSDELVLRKMSMRRPSLPLQDRPREFAYDHIATLGTKGHRGAVLSCDIHPLLPLVVTSSNDGRIKIWRLPQSLLSRFPTWPTSPPPPRKGLSPIRNQELVEIGPPIFSSGTIHSGQWPDQIVWASTAGLQILSKAGKIKFGIDDEGGVRSKVVKEVKLWEPVINLEEEERGLEPKIGSYGPAKVAESKPSAWNPLATIFIDDTNILGSQFALVRSSTSHRPETILIIPNNTTSSIVFYTPLSSSQFSTSSSPYKPPTSPSVFTTSPPSTTDPIRLQRLKNQLFPGNRDRLNNEHDPLLTPAFVGKLGGRNAVVNGVAVSANGKWVVGVGWDGAWQVWRCRTTS